MSDEVQQSNEGVSLALSAVAEVLSKMDERLAKQDAEEVKKSELAEVESQKLELAEMIKSIVSQAVSEFTKADDDDKDEENIDDIIEEIEEDEEEEVDKEYEEDDEDDEEEVEKGRYRKSKDSNSEISSLKKQIAELRAGVDEKIEKETDNRLRKLGFREETGLKAPAVVRYDTMGVEDTTPIRKSEEPSNVVEQLVKMSYTQLRTLQHKIQSGDTEGVPRELIEG